MTIINRLPITKARINLGQIARRAHNGKEYFILEKDGIPVIGIMSANELEGYLKSLNPGPGTPNATGRKIGPGRISRFVSRFLPGLKGGTGQNAA